MQDSGFNVFTYQQRQMYDHNSASCLHHLQWCSACVVCKTTPEIDQKIPTKGLSRGIWICKQWAPITKRWTRFKFCSSPYSCLSASNGNDGTCMTSRGLFGNTVDTHTSYKQCWHNFHQFSGESSDVVIVWREWRMARETDGLYLGGKLTLHVLCDIDILFLLTKPLPLIC